MATDIVIDTSVVVSALIGKKGASRELLRRCLLEEFNPVISNALFQECEAVISREKILRQVPLGKKEIRDLLNAYYSRCRWVPIYYLWRPNLRDQDDNFLVELALAGNANVIVTNNVKDLQGAELSFDHLEIAKPEQLLRGN